MQQNAGALALQLPGLRSSEGSFMRAGPSRAAAGLSLQAPQQGLLQCSMRLETGGKVICMQESFVRLSNSLHPPQPRLLPAACTAKTNNKLLCVQGSLVRLSNNQAGLKPTHLCLQTW